MWPVNALEWGKLFNGEWESDSFSLQYRAKPSDYENWAKLLKSSITAEDVLSRTESASEFFRIEQDLALLIPQKQRTEFFYSLKNGFVAPGCPAQFIYFAKAIYAKYHICNLIGPLLPRDVKQSIHRGGYFGSGYTARDAVCNFINPDFRPITEVEPIVKIGSWYEAYVPAIDMVVALPTEIGKLLQAQELSQITYDPGVGLMLGDRPLSSLGTEVPTSVYDLRAAV